VVTVANNIKVSLIGLDALSWSYLNKLIDNGCIPEVKNIINKGFKYFLECFPPTTPSSWSSILTGVNPGKHGVFAFDYVDPKTLDQKLYSAMDLEHPRIHEMLSMLNIKSIVINPVPGYPIVPISKSIIISHTILIPKPQYYPKSKGKYAKILAEVVKEGHGETCSETLEYYLKYVSALREAVEKLAYEEPWNFFSIILPIPDVILHKCEHDFLKKTVPLETKLFAEVDRLVKTLSRISDVAVLVSDHGFSYYRRLIRINDILAREGLLETIGKRGFEGALKEYKEVKAEFSGKHVSVDETFVDKFRSKAFYISKWNLGVYICDLKVIPRVLKLLNSVDGIRWAKLRENVFHGPYVGKAPHIIVRPMFEEGFMQGDNKVKGVIYEEGIFKDHSPEGILIVKAGNVKLLDTIKIPNYLVTLLIMSLMGAPLSNVSDGLNVLQKVFIEEKPKITFKNYIVKWRILKKLASRVRYCQL